MPDLPPVAEDVLTQARAYTEDETASTDPQALVAGLLAVIDLIECPHVITDGTTSHCDLAEGRVRALADLLAKSEQRYRVGLDQRADLEQDNEGLSNHVAFMERYRMRATSLGVEAEALLDAVKNRLDRETGDDATPDEFHEGAVDALTRVIAHPAAVRLRALLADPPRPERNDA